MNELKANCDEAIMQQDSGGEEKKKKKKEKTSLLQIHTYFIGCFARARFKLTLRARGLGSDAFI